MTYRESLSIIVTNSLGFVREMIQKPIIWIGSLVILAAGGFCWWALLRYRNAYGIIDSRYNLLTVGLFAAPVVAVVATSLWCYFNKKR